jgi:hypothetical protein
MQEIMRILPNGVTTPGRRVGARVAAASDLQDETAWAETCSHRELGVPRSSAARLSSRSRHRWKIPGHGDHGAGLPLCAGACRGRIPRGGHLKKRQVSCLCNLKKVAAVLN